MSRFGWSLMWAALLAWELASPALRAAAAPVGAVPPEAESALSAEDERFLDWLMSDFLFDPKGAEYVVATFPVPELAFLGRTRTVEGWLLTGKPGQPSRVYLTDSHSVLAPPAEQITKVDFVAACRAKYAPSAEQVQPGEQECDVDHLAAAAWLYRLGHAGLAVRALAESRRVDIDPRDRLRSRLASLANYRLFDAFKSSDDEVALAHGERLLRLYPDVADSSFFHQTKRIIAELKRRQEKRASGKQRPNSLPEDFAAWDVKTRTAYLIDALEDESGNVWSLPTRFRRDGDSALRGLVRIGDPAVPALLDVLENDQRLTRVEAFRHSAMRPREFLSVRDVALVALKAILRVRTQNLRGYWTRYGHLPFDERMICVMTDPKAAFDDKRESVENLLNLGEKLMSADGGFTRTILTPAQRNPLLSDFKYPTVAEAILAALDSELTAYAAKPDAEQRASVRDALEEHYLWALIRLGDKRMKSEAVRRCQSAQSVVSRGNWAYAAHRFGEPHPLRVFADKFRLGKIRVELDPNGEPSEGQVRDIVAVLVAAGTPEADQALEALTELNHPYYEIAYEQVLDDARCHRDSLWLSHPFCLVIVQAEVGPDGVVSYAIIAPDGVRRALPEELTDIESVAELEREYRRYRTLVRELED